MLSNMTMAEYQGTRRHSLPLKSQNFSGMGTKEKLERYRQLLLKEEEIRAKLERVTITENGDSDIRIPRVLLSKKYHSEPTGTAKRKMSCPAIRIEVEREIANMPSSMRSSGSPSMARRTSPIPDIRVQPISGTLMPVGMYRYGERNPDFLQEPNSKYLHRRKMSCPSPSLTRKFSSIEDLRDSPTGSPRTAPRRMSMQPTFAEIRALQAKEKLERRKASLKSLEEDVLKAQNVIAMARTISLTSLAESQTEEPDEKEDRLRKTASCLL